MGPKRVSKLYIMLEFENATTIFCAGMDPKETLHSYIRIVSRKDYLRESQ